MATELRNSTPRRSRAPQILLGLFLIFVLGVALTVIGFRRATAGLPGRIASVLLGRPTSYETTVPVVVDKIRQLSRLETVSYSMDTIVEGHKSSSILPDLLFGDRLLLVVHGQSIAGVDLAKLKSEDVRITNGTLHVVLPTAEIFVTAVDNNKTRVYSRTTGYFVQSDPNLESDTRAKAEDQLRDAALKDGILDNATHNARATITTMLNGLGFQHVVIQ